VSAPRRIEVRDRGPGVSEDERKLVLERFHRGRAGRAGPRGDGLGLPIARELTRTWGGEVTIGSRVGGGAVATLAIALPPRGRRDRRTATEATLPGFKPSLATFWGDVTRNTVILGTTA
jgi:K+-sensing histidine kinase KdpD